MTHCLAPHLDRRHCREQRRCGAARWWRKALPLLAAGLLLAGTANAQQPDAGARCGPLRIVGHYGPFDYVSDRPKLDIVEGIHFTPRIEALIGSPAGVGSDLNYTLKASPNHHRALIALTRFSLKSRDLQPPGLEWPLECYFDRAIRFQPEDPIVRMVYAQYLNQTQRQDAAAAQLDAAIAMAPDNALTQYNAGLIFFEMKRYDRALKQAHAAIKLGHQRQELPDLLKKVDRWQEPPPP